MGFIFEINLNLNPKTKVMAAVIVFFS